jgi:murein L,D-transpeptidase YcbB/YkuD
MKIKQLFFIFLLGLLISFPLAAGAATAEEFLSALSRHLRCFPLQQVDLSKQEISITNENLCLAAIYKATGMKPLWVGENGPGEKAVIIRQFLENAETEGLRPDDYNVEGIRFLWQSDEPDHLAQLETQLTLNLLKYAHDVSHGGIMPFKTDPVLYPEAGDTHLKPVLLVEKARAATDLAGYLASLPPSHEYYRKLRDALQFYRNIAKSGGWKKVANGKTIRPGDQDERIRQVRQRLAKTGELSPPEGDETLYDNELIQAVTKFQEQFGLVADGIIGRETLTALNMSSEEIIDKIILNMTRWRWQEKELGRRYIIVNIANYDLKAFEDGREVLKMEVIVGKLQHQTPVFTSHVQYVDFNPFWNVPPSIAEKEELPELRKDAFYLVNRKVRLFSSWQDDGIELDSTTVDWQSVTDDEMKRYKLRQDPGPWNALGSVKLVFPNEYSVFIHGTPAQELFEHNKRNFSHGCIRVSQPLDLARFALSLEKPGWSMEKIQEIVDQGARKVVSISSPLTIHITYQTVWIDNLGTIHFNSDVYGRDKILAEILFGSSDKTAGTFSNMKINN